MKYAVLLFIGFFINSFAYAQDTTSTTNEQDTVMVLSTEDSQAAEHLYNDGVTFFTQGEYTQAISKFDEATSIKANFPKAYYNRALCNVELKNLQSALTDLGNAIMYDPNAKAYYLRGTVNIDLNQLEVAKSDFLKAISIDSADVKGKSFYYLGGIDFEQKKYEEAIVNYDSALHIIPNYAYAFNDRGSANRMLNKINTAIEDYSKAILADSNMATAYSNRASAKRKNQDLDGAVTDYTSAIKIDSAFVLAYNARGVVYKEQEEYDSALLDFDRAIKLDSKYTFAYNNRGNVKYKMRKYHEAV